jgi:hypothetical protein
MDVSSKGMVRLREVASIGSIRQGTHDRRKNPRGRNGGGTHCHGTDHILVHKDSYLPSQFLLSSAVTGGIL